MVYEWLSGLDQHFYLYGNEIRCVCPAQSNSGDTSGVTFLWILESTAEARPLSFHGFPSMLVSASDPEFFKVLEDRLKALHSVFVETRKF